MTERGERPAGVLHTTYNPARAETSVYLNEECIGTVSDLQLMRMTRDGLAVDWDAWRTLKRTIGEHDREEEK